MKRSILENMGRNKKACSLCFREIKEKTRYNIFKHNTLFRLNGPEDIWNCLTKHYVCENCMEKLQSVCQAGLFADGE